MSACAVTVAFGGLRAVSEVSLDLNQGEILGLIGPNGAGKTTLVNCLTGFQTLTEGEVLLDGKSCNYLSASALRKSGVARTFQAGRLFSDLTVLENVKVASIAVGTGRNEVIRETGALLEWLELVDRADVLAGALPYTDQRRVGIARALVGAPGYLLLDEPAAGMSDAECEELVKLIGEIPERFSCGVLLIEHNMHVVMSICDRIHVLDGGKSIAEGTPVEIRNNQAVISAYLGGEE